ncbi:MAG: peptidoglycan DD-metalloendopeptidase family protein [Bacteroidaceae bacterium]|nr:peptidoglycan DD-metalloendopeptidase family protein [Bacteroidaceae bacterium]
MTMKRIIKSLLITILTLSAAAPAAAQDLLARQAPIDYKLKAIDSVSLRRMLRDDIVGNPAAMLYGNWGEHFARNKAQVPDSFNIELRNFCMPATSRIVMSDFGLRRGRQHKGVDIKVYTGDTIRAAFSGKVRIVRFDEKGYGNYVVIRHHNGLETIYGHMSKNLVAQDQTVKAGTPIGLGGNTGRSASSHLHFETRFCGIALDPSLLFDFRNQDVTADYYVFHNADADRPMPISKTDVADASDSQKAATPAKQQHYHKVAKGETLGAIARKHHTTVDKLCRLNHISKTSTLRLGQILKYN